MNETRKLTIKEIFLMGIFATLFMDVGYLFIVYVVKIIQPSMMPYHLGRWILYMFQGIFVHDDIRLVNPIFIEKPVTPLMHYMIGIFLAAVFFWMRKNVKLFPKSIYMGIIFGWITVILPWFIMYPALGFGFLGLDCPQNTNYIFLSFFNHTLYGLGITLWLGLIRKVVIKDIQK
ncbi:DUF2938 family protein [Thermodesulfobacteriota bacterium]